MMNGEMIRFVCVYIFIYAAYNEMSWPRPEHGIEKTVIQTLCHTHTHTVIV